MDEAIDKIRRELGSDMIIMNSKTIIVKDKYGIEKTMVKVVAGVEEKSETNTNTNQGKALTEDGISISLYEDDIEEMIEECLCSIGAEEIRIADIIKKKDSY
jgi:flagellar biosynthesis GTPase FlhF